MRTETTVVTAARFEQGLSWADFLAGATVNRDKFGQNYASPVLTETNLDLFRALVQIAEFGRVHWSFGELRTSDEQAEQHRRVVCRAAL
jgi:hypothetical protein